MFLHVERYARLDLVALHPRDKFMCETVAPEITRSAPWHRRGTHRHVLIE